MTTPNCPDRRRLAEFTAGKLDEPSSERITVHLEQCTDCQSTIVNLAGDQDTVGAALRKVSQSPAQSHGAAVQKALNSAARMIPSPPSGRLTASPAAPGGPVVTLSLEQFAQQLSETGVVDGDEMTAARSRLPTEQREDPQALARELINAGQLTKFQALNALQGKAKGLVFGEYLVIDRIGAGGMGQVFKAKHRRMDRIVALKVMSPAAMKNADSVKRFQREVKAAAKLTHPNIVTAHDAGEQDGVHFLVMEFVDGPDLSSLVKKQGKLAPKQAADFIAQAARGLAYAHEQGIVHRDIKPGNLLADRNGVVKILDLGLARFDGPGASTAKTDAELTQSGAVMGTVDYMAPEQALNTRHADAKSDVYSLGCALYRLLTGESMYAGETMVEKILAHREQAIPSLRVKRPEVPPTLEAMQQRMVAKKPADRPSMKEIAEVLGSLDLGAAGLSGVGLKVGSPPSPLVGEGSGVRGVPVAPMIAPTINPGLAPLAPVRGEGPGVRGDVSTAKPKTKGAAPPKKRSNAPLLAAAGAGALLIALGVWFIFRDDKGNEIGRVQLPDGGSVKLLAPGESPGAPQPGANSGTGADPLTPGGSPGAKTAIAPQTTDVDPSKMFALPQSTGTVAPPSTTVAAAPSPPLPPSPLAGEGSGVRGSVSSAGGWIDVLALADPVQDSLAGTWTRKNGEVSVAATSIGRLVIPVYPTANYEWEIEFTRLTGDKNLTLFFPVGQQETVYSFGTLAKYNSLLWMDGKRAADDNPTKFVPPIETGRRYKATFEVRVSGNQGHIIGKLDGKEILNWQGDQSRLGTDPQVNNWSVPYPQCLAVGAQLADTVFHSAKLRLLDGELKPVRPGVVVPAAAPVAASPSSPINVAPPQPAAFDAAAERQTVIALMNRGVVVDVAVGESRTRVKTVDKLPAGELRIVALDIPKSSNFTDAELASIQNLSSVESLRLLSPLATDQGLSAFRDYVNLQSATIYGTQLQGPGLVYLSRLPKLRTLITGNELMTDATLASTLAQFTQLENLQIRSSPITHLQFVRTMPHLKHLTIGVCPLTSLAGLETLRELTQLNIYTVNVADPEVVYCQNLTQVEDLILYGTPITDACLSRLESLPNVQTMNFQKTYVTEAGAARLRARYPNAKFTLGTISGTPPQPVTALVTPPPMIVPPLATSATALTGTVDLLSLIKLPRDVVTGTWSMSKGELLGKGGFSRVQIPFTPPDEYDLTITGKAQGDYLEHLHIGLVSQGRQFYVRVGTRGCGISDDDASKAPNFAPAVPLSKLNHSGPLICAVRKDSVTVLLGDEKIYEFRGDFNQLRVDDPYAVPRKDQLFLALAQNSIRWSFSAITLKPVGVPTSAPATPPATAPATQPAAVDLLALVQLPRDLVNGHWARNGALLISDGIPPPDGANLLQIPYAPTVPEYDLVYSARYTRPPNERFDCFMVGMPGPRVPMYLRVSPDGAGINDGDTWKTPNIVSGMNLPMTQPFTLKVSVRRDAVTADFNGRQFYEFRVDQAQLKMNPVVNPRNRDQLFLVAQGALEFSSLQFVPVGASAPIASVAPLGLPAPAVGDPAVVCTKLSAKAKPIGLHASATAFSAQPGDGRSGANGFFIPTSPRFLNPGSIWDFTYQWSGTAHTVIMIHPTGNGHLRVHLQKDRVNVFPGGAWTNNWNGGSTYPISIETGATNTFPLPAATPLRVKSQLDRGTYSLWIDGKLVVTAKFNALSPQEMKPPIPDPACPPVLPVGSAALIIGPRDGGVHDATDIRLTTIGGEGVPSGGGPAVASVTPVNSPFTPPLPVAPAAPVERKPIPPTSELAEATKLIKDIFKDDYAEALKSPDKKSPLAQKLLQQAAQAGNEPAQAYALLTEAKTLAADAGDVLALRTAVDRLIREFELEGPKTSVDAWEELLRKPRPNPTIKQLHDEALAQFGPAVADGRLDDAKQYADFALSAARRLKDTAVTKDATDRNSALVARRTEWDAVKAAAEKLQESPDDAAANFAVGRYRGVVLGDWPGALPLLVKSSDAGYKALAEKSLAPGADAAAVADAWWDAAQTAAATRKPEYYAAAAHWYKQASATAAGLQKTRIDKRLADAQALVPEQKLPPTRLSSLPQFANEAATIAAAPAPFNLPATPQPAAPTAPPVGNVAAPNARPLPNGFRLPPNAVPGLIGRMTLTQNGQGFDSGVLFTYTPGTVFLHETVVPLLGPNGPAIITAKGITIQMAGVLYVPSDMEVAVWHAGGSSTGGNVFLYIDGKEVSNVGDDKGKNNAYRLPLSRGEHAIGWKFRGGLLGNSLVDFMNGQTGEPLAVYAPADIVVTARSAPTRQQVDNSSDQKRPSRPPTLPPAPTAAPATSAPAVAPTPPPPGVGSTFTPSTPVSVNPTVDYAAERRAAEWILRVGGQTSLVTLDGKAGGNFGTNGAPLPTTDFKVSTIKIRGVNTVVDADLVNLAGVTGFKTADLASTSITGLGLQHLARSAGVLTTLNLDSCPITDDGAAPIALLKNVKSLQMSNSKLTDRGMAFVAKLTELTSIGLNNAQITDASLPYFLSLHSLVNLNLRSTKVTDAGIPALIQMTQLKTLDLAGTPVTSAGVQRIQQALPNCKIQR